MLPRVSDEKRAQILQAVWSVIARDGLPAVSVRSVAAAAGASPGRVQHYYPTKQDLVRSSAAAMIEGAAEISPEALSDPAEPGTLWALLTHSITPAATSRAGTSVYFSYVAASGSDSWIAQTLSDARGGVLGEVRRCLLARGATVQDVDGEALELTLLAEGATQAVFVGWCTAEQALDQIRRALARIGLDGPS